MKHRREFLPLLHLHKLIANVISKGHKWHPNSGITHIVCDRKKGREREEETW